MRLLKFVLSPLIMVIWATVAFNVWWRPPVLKPKLILEYPDGIQLLRSVANGSYSDDGEAKLTFVSSRQKKIELLRGKKQSLVQVFDMAGGEVEQSFPLECSDWPQGHFLLSPDGRLLMMQADVITHNSVLWDLRSTPGKVLYAGGGCDGSSWARCKFDGNIALARDGRVLLIREMYRQHQVLENQFIERLLALLPRTHEPAGHNALHFVDVESLTKYATIDGADNWALMPDGNSVAIQKFSTQENPSPPVQVYGIPAYTSVKAKAAYTFLPLVLVGGLSWLWRRRALKCGVGSRS